MSRIVCLRHCQSVDNAAGIHSSRPPGTGLTELGVRQARAALAAIGEEPVAAVYTSTARRAIETAEIVAAGFGLTTTEDQRLLEYDIGTLEGGQGGSVGPQSRELLRRWLVDADLDVALPAGETGRAVVDRFSASMTQIARMHDGETVVVVTHVGTLTVGLVSLCSDLHMTQVWGRPLAHGVPVVVSLRESSGWSCANWPQ